MDCGIPFCHDGCPLGNRIPDWNDLVRTGDVGRGRRVAARDEQLPGVHRSAVPGARARPSCVLGIGGVAAGRDQAGRGRDHQPGVRARAVVPRPAAGRVPAGGSPWSAPARPGSPPPSSSRAPGTTVTVYERDDAIGGLLRYGIPDFKLEKHHIDRRVAQLAAEGVRFVTGCDVGVDVTVDAAARRLRRGAAGRGALAGRDLPETPGRALRGVHLAMDAPGRRPTGMSRAGGRGRRSTRPASTWSSSAAATPAADCLGVAHRQGAAGVTQLDIYPLPPSRHATTTATRGRPGRGSCATTRPTRRAASASSPWRCRSSWTTAPGRCGRYGSPR